LQLLAKLLDPATGRLPSHGIGTAPLSIGASRGMGL
jgi:hypothetical protein